jgi:hypothetical protein
MLRFCIPSFLARLPGVSHERVEIVLKRTERSLVVT